MGWTEYIATHYKNGTVNRKAECDVLFDNNRAKVLKSRMVGSTYYAAVQVYTPDKATNIQWDTEDDEFSKEDILSLPDRNHYSRKTDGRRRDIRLSFRKNWVLPFWF